MQETGPLVHYKSILFIILFLISPLFFPQEYPENGINTTLKSGIDYIINQNYSAAKSEFQKLNNRYPDLPLGKIYLAAVEIARSYDYGEEYDEELIMNYLEQAEKQSEVLLKKEPENVWYHYFMGLTKGYISYYHALNGSWFQSLKEAVSSVSSLEECTKRENNFYEAYAGIGSYKYWKSKKTNFLNWLPFIDDEREEGISLLENAVDKSSYNIYLAVNSLIWIYIDRKNYTSAIHVCEKALKKYPSSRFFKWGIARAYEDVDPKKAISYYNEILSSYPNLSSMNKYNEIVLKHLMAQQYSKIGENEKALRLCNEILAIKKISNFTLDKLGNRLDRVRELKSSLLQYGG
jgi:hypothetical protein